MGHRIIFCKNDLTAKGFIVSVIKNKDLHIQLNDGSEILTPHEFVEFDPDHSAKNDSLPDQVVKQLNSTINEDLQPCTKLHEPLTNV